MTTIPDGHPVNLQVDVHRITPGSPYTVAGCVTLCRSCHGDKPKRRSGKGDSGFFVMDREVVQLAKAAAALDGLNLAEWLSETIRPIAEKRLAKPSVKMPKKDGDA